jgi:hypothetical protein
VPDELGSRHSRQAALDKRAVGPRRVQRPEVGQPARIHVLAAQVQPLTGPLVQLAVQTGQGAGHQQIGHPVKAVQTFREQTNGRRRGVHSASVRDQASVQIQLS